MKIAILGATGTVGSSAAFQISMSGLADELLLIGGKRQNVLEHHAIDLSTAAAETEVDVFAGDYSDLAGVDIVINAAGAHQPLAQKREDIISAQTRFVKNIAYKIKTVCPEAVIISAINPIDSTTYATYLAGGFRRSQLLGYSFNDTLRFRIALARELKVSLGEVDAAVLGEHGATQVPLFSSVRVNGEPVNLTDDAKDRILAETPKALKKFESLKAGRTAGWTCAVGLTKIVRAIVEDDGSVIPCSVVLDGEYGQTEMSMAVPVVIGGNGVREILEYPLKEEEISGLAVTIKTIREDIALVRSLMS